MSWLFTTGFVLPRTDTLSKTSVLDDCLEVIAPPDYVIMVTYLVAMAASGAVVCVEGYALCPQNNNTYAGDIDCAAVPLHSVLRTSVVSLYVYSEALGNYNHTFLFSFHAQSAVPQLLHDDTWNCSVTYYDEFADHLACDLFRDCQGVRTRGTVPTSARRVAAVSLKRAEAVSASPSATWRG